MKLHKSSERKSYPDYTKFLDSNGLKGARIGVLRAYFGFLPSVDKVINSSLEILKQNGAILIDPIEIDSLGRFDDSESTVLLYELKADMAAYLKHRGPNTPFHTLKDLIDFNKKHADKEMPYFNQELFLKGEAKGPVN